jgi:hypothetical protein
MRSTPTTGRRPNVTVQMQLLQSSERSEQSNSTAVFCNRLLGGEGYPPTAPERAHDEMSYCCR